MQGSVPGGFLTSNQLSKVCKKMYESDSVYMYMGKIPIPGLAMVDDLVTFNLCNCISGIQANIQVDSFVKGKKLECQVGSGKCQWIHIGENQCQGKYFVNGKETDMAEKYKYLGDMTSNNIEYLYSSRADKANGYRAINIAMATEISLGYRMFSIAKLLHRSLFLSATLVNMETWPHCTIARLEIFEKIEQHYFRTILSGHSKCPIETIYLSMGIIPFRFHLMKKRITYYQLIIKRDKCELTRQIIEAQKTNSLKGDFYCQVISDMEYLGITEMDIIIRSEENLKSLVSDKIESCAYRYLIEKGRNHSKTRTEIYKDLKGSQFLFDKRFTPELSKLVFMFQTRSYGVRNNFRNNYQGQSLNCLLCEEDIDQQSHIIS